ncbi:MAG: class I SAM-dependent methyltransferase [Myxococcales bacterium]|nr:class I SAM-dependent methyltransferase [Myxococcales bacterium]
MDRDEENQLSPGDLADAWAEEAATWNEDPAVVAYADAAWASLLASVPVGSDAHVLDFGCGTGLLTERISPRVREVVAVDASPAMVEVLATKALPNVRFGVAKWTPETISDDELAAGPFDLIVCSSVCAFLDDYPGTVAMLADRLAPNGYFAQWDWELDPTAAEPFGLTSDGITKALVGAGLEVVSVGIGFDVPIEDQHMRPLMGIGRRVRE